MFCPCCAGRTSSSSHHLDQSGNSDGDGRCLASDQFETHRVSEPCMPRIPGDLLSVPIPAITNLPAESIRHRLPNWIYCTRVQRHAIWGYLSLNQICRTYAERLLVENDHKLSHLYFAEEVLGGARVPSSLTGQVVGSCESSGGRRSGHDHHAREDGRWQGDVGQRAAWIG